MIVPVHPPIEGVAAERFRALARQLMQAQQKRRQVDFDEVCSQEILWCLSDPHLNGCRDTYEAAVRVLVDLARLNWTIQENRFGVELQAPSFLPRRGIAPDQVMRSKQAVRYELSPLRDAQFRNPSVRDFIQRLENPTKNSGRKSILRLVADGRELRARLQPSLATAGDERVTHLAEAIRPYVQLVDADEREEHTDILQGEVWRYFRYTWSLPATSIPGRQLLYLVRDAAHPHHAVMGIAALSNCAMQMRERDNFIGWTAEAFAARVEATLGSDSPARDLSGLFSQLEDNIADALADVEAKGLATRAEIKKPTAEIVARLRRLSQEFAAERQEALEEIHDRNLPYLLQETEAGPYGVPLAEEVLLLEKKVHDQPEFRKARAAMVAKKRALELSRLLQARLRLREIKDRFLDPKRNADVLYLEETRMAITMALMANKSRRVGANMLELTTCGAIPPYNHLLAGKLTALLLLSPQVADDYRRRYGSEPSIISSLLKNAPLVRDSTLVYLGTTSLYALGSSQYERLRLPAGIIAPEQPELHYERVGYTSGYGTVQFAPETAQAVETVVMKHAGFREVNSIFGEGPSPRLRKLRTGLKLLGFDPENLLRHNQHRLIFGVPLAENALAFIRGEDAKLPDYLKRPGRYRNATERIAAFWTRRWLASRLNHTPAIESLAHTPAWKLSDQIPVATSASAAPVLAETSPSGNAGQPSSEVEFWRSIAHAGPEVCSDELTQEEISRLHVKRPLEDFLVRKVGQGFSLVLTGNAGDGKTHLLRRLQEKLAANGIKAVVEPDATAAMKHGELAPVLEGWRKALAAKKPYLIAANEYPLYQLRKDGPKLAPSLGKVLASVDSQCRARLAYGAKSTDEDAADKVLVVDLSLRNPLQRDFAEGLLDRLLRSRALQQHAREGTEPNFTRNFDRLSQPRVRDRLLGLLQRLVVRGKRAPVRELWILLARLLFGSRLVMDEVPDAMNARYSERLFERDDRFGLSLLLAELADPSDCSHPQWDARLEQPGSTKPADWMEAREPMPDLRELDPARFAFLKRVFYFEHIRGIEAFALEEEHAERFVEQLDEARQGDPLLRGEILRAINLCYCPKPFRGMEDRLHLWIGHRYHELPTRSYIANQFVPADRFDIFVPRLPRRLEDKLDYQPDHFLLRHCADDGKAIGLRVDFPLFATLAHLHAGLPRHLMPDRDLNRLDAFLEQLQATFPPQYREFVTFNTVHRIATRIRLSADWKRYVEVKENE
jgi:Druantia protein DruA